MDSTPTLEVKPGRRLVTEEAVPFNEFWSLFSSIAFTLSEQALIPLKSIEIELGCGHGVQGSHKADMPGTTFLHMCACISTQPWESIDTHSHNHKLRKAKTACDLSEP